MPEEMPEEVLGSIPSTENNMQKVKEQDLAKPERNVRLLGILESV